MKEIQNLGRYSHLEWASFLCNKVLFIVFMDFTDALKYVFFFRENIKKAKYLQEFLKKYV